jgi:hypothetical protein
VVIINRLKVLCESISNYNNSGDKNKKKKNKKKKEDYLELELFLKVELCSAPVYVSSTNNCSVNYIHMRGNLEWQVTILLFI